MKSMWTGGLPCVMAATLIVSLAGCGKEPDATPSASEAASQSTDASEAAQSEATTAPASDPAATTVAKGEIIWPDLPGASQSCLGVEGAIKDGAEIVLHDCKPTKDAIFVKDAKGQIGIAGHPELCLGGNKSDSATVLSPCSDAGSGYTLAASNVQSAQFQDSAGGCVAIPDIDNPDKKFPWSLGAMACSDGGVDAPKFYFGE